MSTYHVEYYSNDCEAWIVCGTDDIYCCLDAAVDAMRLEAECDPNMTHRVIRSVIHRSTVAMAAYGEELIK